VLTIGQPALCQGDGSADNHSERKAFGRDGRCPSVFDRRIVTEFRETFHHSKKGFLRFASYLFFSIEEKEREKVILLYREKR